MPFVLSRLRLDCSWDVEFWGMRCRPTIRVVVAGPTSTADLQMPCFCRVHIPKETHIRF